MYIYSLYLESSNVFLLFEREGLDIEGLSLTERKFNSRESLSLDRNDLFSPTLGGILFSLGMTFLLGRNPLK